MDSEREYQLMYFFCMNFRKVKSLLQELLEQIEKAIIVKSNKDAINIKDGDWLVILQVKINLLY